MVFPAKYPSLNATEMTEEARQTLIRVLRVAFPMSPFLMGPTNEQLTPSSLRRRTKPGSGWR